MPVNKPVSDYGNNERINQRLVTQVGALLMHSLCAVLGERLVAIFAFVRPFAGVGSFVDLKRGLLGESLFAVGALERPLARVRPHVRLEYREIGERFAAEADMRMLLMVRR